MGSGGQAYVSKTCSVLDTLPYSVSTVLTGWGRRKNLKLRLSGGWKMPSWDWFLQIR